MRRGCLSDPSKLEAPAARVLRRDISLYLFRNAQDNVPDRPILAWGSGHATIQRCVGLPPF
jgi:hypothetical protein